MEELYKKLYDAKEYSDDYSSFKSDFGTPEAQAELHKLLQEKDLVSRPLDQWQKKYFSGDAVVDVDALTEKKKPEVQAGLPVAGVGSKTASPATQANGEVEFVNVPEGLAAPKGVAETPEDDIAGLLAQPTGQLAYNWVMNAARKSGTAWEPTPEDMAIGQAAVPHLEALAKRKDLSPEQKYLDAKRMLANASSSTSGGKALERILQNDIAKSEEDVERSNPEGYKQVLAARLDDAFSASGMKNRQQWEKMRLASSLSDAFGNDDMGQMAKQEADLRMARETIAARDLSYAKDDPKAMDELARKRDSELAMLDGQINELRNVRLSNIDGEIEQLEKVITSSGGTPEDKSRLQTLMTTRDHYLDPKRNEAKVLGMFKEEIDAQPGKTPREKMRNLYLSYDQQLRELQRYAVGESGGEAALNQVLAGTIGGTDDVTRRYNTLLQRKRALAPAVFFNQGPTEQTTGEALVQSAKDFFGGVKTTAGASDASVAADIQESLIAAGISPDALNPEVVKDLNKRAEGYGLLDPRFYAEMAGTVGALMAQAAVGGAATKGLSAPKWVSGSKVLSTLFGMAKQGAAYEVGGRFWKDSQDELDFVSGMAGGAVESAMGAGVLKKMTKNVFGTFGDKAPMAFEVIKKAGSGAVGESFEETLQDLWHVYRDTGSFQQFIEGHDTWGENLKYYFGVMLMGGGMGAGTALGQGASQEAARVYQQELTPEERVIADEQVQQAAKSIEQGVSGEASAAPQAEAIETAQSFGVGTGEAGTETAPEKRIVDKAEMLEFAKDQKDFPEAYAKGDALTKFRLRQSLGVVGQPDPVNTLKQGVDNSVVEEAVVEAPVSKEATVETPNVSPETKSKLEAAMAEMDNVSDASIAGLSVIDPTSDEGIRALATALIQKPAEGGTTETAKKEDKKQAQKKAVKKAIEKPAEARDISDVAEVIADPDTPVEAKNEAEEAIVQKVEPILSKAQPETKEVVAEEQDNTPPKSGDDVIFMRNTYGGKETETGGKIVGEFAPDDLHPEGQWKVEFEVVEGQKTTMAVPKTGNIRKGTLADTRTELQKKWAAARAAVANMSSSGIADDVETATKQLKALVGAFTDLGVELMKAGTTEVKKWTEDMVKLTGEKYRPLIVKMHGMAKARFESEGKKEEPQAEVTEEAASKGEPKPVEPKAEAKEEVKAAPEPKEETKKERTGRESGTQLLLEKHIELAGTAVKDFIDRNPLTKTTYDQQEEYEDAAKEVKSAIKSGKVGDLVARLTKLTPSDTDQFMRMVLARTYGAAIDSAVEARDKAMVEGDTAAAEKLDSEIGTLRENMVLMINAMSENATNAGRIGAASAYWMTIAAGLDSYAITGIERLNKKARETTLKNGRQLGAAIDKGTKAANDARKKHADEIADKTVAGIDAEVESSTRREGSKILGMTKKDAADGLKRALAEYNDIRVGGTASSGGLENTSAYAKKIAAAAKVGYYALANGAFKFADWAKKMKGMLPDLSEDDLKTIWENEVNGTVLKDEAEKAEAESKAQSMLPKAKVLVDKQKLEQRKEQAETRARVRETIRDHFKAPDGRGLQEKLIEAGLGDVQAEAVVKAVDANAQVIMKDSIDGAFDHIQSGLARKKARLFKAPKKAEKRSNGEILISQLVNGDLSDKYIEGLVGHKFGMGKMPSADQIKRLREIGNAIDKAPAGGVIHNLVTREAAKILDEIMPWSKDSNFQGLSEVVDIYQGLMMSSLLNSPETLATNLHSVTDHFFTGWAKALTNPLEWANWLRATKNAKTFDAFVYSSPLGKTLVKMAAGGRPIQAGFNAFMSGMRTGVISSKYDENVLEGNIENKLGALERTPKTAVGKFLSGKWPLRIKRNGKDVELDLNPASSITGRGVAKFLSSTDAATTMMYSDYEFIDAIRWAAGKGTAKTWKEMMALVDEYKSENSPDWVAAKEQAMEEAAIAADAGVKVPESTIKLRAREIMRPMLARKAGVTVEELAAVQKVAQYNTLTLDRGGSVAKAAELLKTMRDFSPVTKVALTPFFLFTKIPANFAEALLDNTPFINIFRLMGGTGMESRRKVMANKGVVKTSERFWESVSMEDRAFRKMTEQVVFSNMLMMMALALLSNDDENDLKVSMRENDSASDWTFQLGIPGTDMKTPEMSFKNFPAFAPAMIGAKVWSDYVKSPEGKAEQEKPLIAQVLGRGFAMSAALGSFYTDQSFMKGLQDAMKVGQTVMMASRGEATGKQIAKSLIRPYMNLAVKPLWTSQGVTRFVKRLADPHEYKSETLGEIFMSAVGLEFISNEKAVDIFGNVKTIAPFKNIVNLKGLGEAVGWSEKDPNRDLYDFLIQTNTVIEAPRMATVKVVANNERGFDIRQMTSAEQAKVLTIAGKQFASMLREYKSSSDYAQSKEMVALKGDNVITKVQADIAQLWSDARSSAKKEVFGEMTLTETEVESKLNDFFKQFKLE